MAQAGIDILDIIPGWILWVGGITVVVFAIGGVFIVIREAGGRPAAPEQDIKTQAFQSNEYLLTDRERDFLRALDPMAEGLGLRVCPNVRLWDVVSVAPGSPPGTHNRIDRKHLDFVLVESASMRIYACIELQDSTHRRSDRKRSDRTKVEVLKSAEIPLLTFGSVADLESRGIVV